MSKVRIHVVTYTHWDREFRWEFERTRMRLVDCVDRLLEIMERDGHYRHFMLDGQFALVDDYLEIRPEKHATIEGLVKAGRLEIGPWYTLPDCAPTNGESVVRNLAHGIRRCEALGGCMRCGYNVFSFGQIAQLPQIYANFGIDIILFYKYMDPARSQYHEFIWEAPDGSHALASRLGSEARWNFFFAGHIPIVYGLDPWHKDWQYRWGDLGKVFHTADPEGHGWFYDVLDPETSFRTERVREGMERALKTVEGTAAPDVVLFFDGTDFTEPHPLTPAYLEEIRKQFGDAYEIIHSTMADYSAELKAALTGRDDLDVVSGPMRDGPVGAVHSDVFTIHPEIPIANSHVENTLLRWAEPLSTIAWAHGIEAYPAAYFDKTWKLLFQSQAHDSLHGLGPKSLAESELARLKQAQTLADGLTRRALQNVTKEIDTSGIEDASVFVAVHNPSSFLRSEVVEAYLDVPADISLDQLVLQDLEGKPIPLQEVDRRRTRAGVYHPRSRNMPFYCTKVHCFFQAHDVPPLGYKTYQLKWTEKPEYPYPHEDWDAPRIPANTLLCGAYEARNEFLRVKVYPDGTLDLTDQETGRVYAGLNYFRDQADVGNMWMSAAPGSDAVLTTAGAPAEVSVSVQGPLAVVFDLRLPWPLPAGFDSAAGKRSDDRKGAPIAVRVVLKKGARYLESAVTFENTVKDHFTKVCFPTGLKAAKTWAEGSFSVTEYPVAPGTDGEARGPALARHPATLWFDLSDGTNGLAVLTDAAKDYEILEHDEAQTLAMGLLRAVRLRIPCDNRLWMEYPGDESAQALGTHTYRYALMPHTGLWHEAGLYAEALAFNTPLRACQFGRQQGMLPTQNGHFELRGDGLVLSAVKKADQRDSLLVRFYNPTDHDIEAALAAGFDFGAAYLVTLGEERSEALEIKGRTVSIATPKGRIVTVELAHPSRN